MPTLDIPDNQLGYFEWMRIRLKVKTPVQAGLQGAKVGDEPPWQPDPDNYTLRSAIKSAASLVNRETKLADAGSIRSLPVAGQSITGPLRVNLGTMQGLRDRSLNSIRRAWWNDGTTSTRLDPVLLDTLDLRGDAYLQDATGTPFRFAIEGYTLYLDPAPASAGNFQFMASCGVLAPQSDSDGFDQIPTDYDPCVLYIALVEYSKMNSANSEMQQRAANFAPDAKEGLEKLGEWFRGGSNEQVVNAVMFDARPFRRQWSYR